MGKRVRKQHPRDRGLVLMTAWVDPALREYARVAARASGVEFSRFVERAVQDAVARASIERAARDAEARADAVDAMNRTGSPGPRFCACGRRTTECDGSRKACASSPGGSK